MGLVRLIFRLFFGRPQRRPQRHPSPWERSERHFGYSNTTASGVSPDAPSHPQAAIVGRAWVIDGDTIDISGTRIRLAGIDAPELGDPYGNKAKFFLVNMCHGQQIRAVFDGELSYERAVATCFLPDGRDLSAEMVKAGLALDWRKFSGGKYRSFEPTDARKRLWRCDARQKGRMPQSIPD